MYVVDEIAFATFEIMMSLLEFSILRYSQLHSPKVFIIFATEDAPPMCYMCVHRIYPCLV